jgi:hypothetical protein
LWRAGGGVFPFSSSTTGSIFLSEQINYQSPTSGISQNNLAPATNH